MRWSFTLIRKVNAKVVNGVAGSQKKGQGKDNSCFYSDPESQHVRRVAKKKDNNSRFYADPESQCQSGQQGRQVAKKKGQEKDNNSRFYTGRSDLEIWSSTALKLLTIIERLIIVTWDYSFKSIIDEDFSCFYTWSTN